MRSAIATSKPSSLGAFGIEVLLRYNFPGQRAQRRWAATLILIVLTTGAHLRRGWRTNVAPPLGQV